MHFVQNFEFENAVFILDFTSQAGDLNTSVISKQISKDMIWLKIKWMILRQPLTSQGQL